MRLFRRLTLVLIGSLLIVWTASSAMATTMVYRSVDELFSMSDAVVRGTVVEHVTYWADDGTMYTDWTVYVDEVLNGNVQGVITLRQMGGDLDDLMLHIPGDAQISDGAHLIVFMRELDGVHYLTAMGQAVMTVSLQGDVGEPGVDILMSDVVNLSPVDATVIRNLSDIVFYEVGDNGPRLYQIENAEVTTLQTLRSLGNQGGE